MPGTPWLSPAQQKLEELKEREVQKLLPWAEYSLLMGIHHPIDNKATTEVRQRAIERALEMRREHLPNVVDALAHQLDILKHTVEPEEVGRYVHASLPGSELVFLKATGHCPNLSAPEETIAAIKAFLAKPGPLRSAA